MTTATFVRKITSFRGDARLFALSDEITHDYVDDVKCDHVIVSAVGVLGRPETYIFPANSHGEVTCWSEMPGSMRDTLSHKAAIAAAGWDLA